MTEIKSDSFLNRLKYIALSCVLISSAFLCGLVFGADESHAETLHTYSIPNIRIEQHEIPALAFKQNVNVRVHLPPNYSKSANHLYPSLYINDGQDAAAVELAETLQRLYAEQKIGPVIVITISMLPERMATYGFSDRDAKLSLPAQTRYGPLGASAYEYSDWLAIKLVPFIDSQYKTIANSDARTMLGWSLGAANAFNIAWNYPDVFSRVGGFSPSFWLSAKAGDISQSLAMKLIASKPMPSNFSIWLAVGMEEETDDRDGDGVIDVIDDSQGVIYALNAKGLQAKKNALHDNFQLKIYQEGKHNQDTWKSILPDFLQWAYPVVQP